MIYIATASRISQGIWPERLYACFWNSEADIPVEKDLVGRSLKSQMKQAGRIGASYVIIFGSEELQSSTVLVRDMNKGEQFSISRDRIVEYLRYIIRGH